MRTAQLLLVLLACTPLLAGSRSRGKEPPGGVSIVRQEGVLVVRFGGELFTEYHYADTRRPYLYPVNAPGGVPVTRGYPMEERPDEARDHPHHQSLWFAHGDVNGFDFWHGGKGNERIQHDEILQVEAKGDVGLVRVRNLWLAGEGEGELVLTEERTMRFGETSGGRTIDFELELAAPEDREVRFGDTKEGTMALRLAPSLRLRGKVAQGRALNSEGLRDGECWGKRAAWVDYSGPVGDAILGVAIFDHPDNPRHPTWWHARDYGLFAANPFGVHDFEKKPAGTGDLVVPPGESLVLRYRVWIHEGEGEAAALQEAFEEYAAE